MRYLAALLILGPWATDIPAQQTPPGPLDGVWEITALIDDGEVVSNDIVRKSLTSDGRMTVRGQTLSFTKTNGQPKTVLFTVDTQTNPQSIDLGGADKTGGRGIYVLAGDTLMVCVSGPEVGVRPTSFGSKAGSHAMLMTLQRVKDPQVSTSQTIPLPPPPVIKRTPDDDIRRILIGTWGHQDSDKVELGTFNADGSFSMTRTWKKAFRKFFDDDERFSGDWRLENGNLVVRITASTESKVRGQVYNYRVSSINDREMVLLDPAGAVRREWKTR
ncbi:MAG: TIGR03067 domain-containing protein [Gemmataceae bacterium]|nr:TIGR03067 domain-containing protein [Gemmataceae bacterium]